MEINICEESWSKSHGPHLKEKFEQLSLRRGHKKALIAVARKQLVILWNVLSKQQTYKEPQIVLSQRQIEQKQKYYQKKLSSLTKYSNEKAGYICDGYVD
jgi:hypothetical protein